MGNSALSFVEMSELDAAFFIQVNMFVLEQKYDYLVAGLVRDIEVVIIIMPKRRKAMSDNSFGFPVIETTLI